MADTAKSIDLNQLSEASEVQRMLAELEAGTGATANDTAQPEQSGWRDRFIAAGNKPKSRNHAEQTSGWARRFIAADGKVQSRNEQGDASWARRFVASSVKTDRTPAR